MHLKQFLNDPEHKDKKILTITDIINLSRQHMNSFKKENINLSSYESEDTDILNNHLTICINSLLKFERTSYNHFKNYIVYIDEINSILNFTHNETISNIKSVNSILMKIVNNAYKVIVSDATISDNVLYFLNKRPDTTKIYFHNTFKKYDGSKQNEN